MGLFLIIGTICSYVNGTECSNSRNNVFLSQEQISSGDIETLKNPIYIYKGGSSELNWCSPPTSSGASRLGKGEKTLPGALVLPLKSGPTGGWANYRFFPFFFWLSSINWLTNSVN